MQQKVQLITGKKVAQPIGLNQSDSLIDDSYPRISIISRKKKQSTLESKKAKKRNQHAEPQVMQQTAP